MNPIIKNLNAYRTDRRFVSQEPMRFNEQYDESFTKTYGLVEYKFKAGFGSTHRISEEALYDSESNVLDNIKQSVSYKLTDVVYGKYISQLHELRIKCLASNRRDLAEDISNIINDITEI